MSEVHTFAGGPLDRAGHRRTQPEWLAKQLADPKTKIVPLWQLRPLITAGGDEIAWMSPLQLLELLGGEHPYIFIGMDQGIAHFALDVTAVEGAKAGEPFASAGRFMDLRAIALQLPVGDPSTLAFAKAILDWNARHQFCAQCGGQTSMQEQGFMRKCGSESCNAMHFPRTDPVVIMLAVRGDKALIGRQPTFPKGMYSALAGFIEPGENIEEAVRREILEEAGITISEVRYHSTQPWPWPSSLMIGCFGEAETEEIFVDGEELEEARWVSRSVLAAAMNGDKETGIMLPPPMAIAHQLLKAFVNMG